jgi:NADPH:quinone reductase-like Zn-dependent oxidoreductase
MMKAAVLHALGKPPQYEQFSEPEAKEGEVIVNVHAAALKPVDKAIASDAHYASPRELPVVCGVDGVGRLADGSRVYFGGPRKPYGAMAERTVVAGSWSFPVPEGIDDVTVAALVNPALSSWLPLTWRARLAPGETVLILGATGVAGKLAVQISKLLGAGRVVAAGRNPQVLGTLEKLGADATIQLDESGQDLAQTFARQTGESGYDVIVDFLWGAPTEALLGALARPEFLLKPKDIRLLPIGESAGPTITLSAAILRTSGLTIPGPAGLPPREILDKSFHQVIAYAASGRLLVDTIEVPLAHVESAWQREDLHGRRIVLIP